MNILRHCVRDTEFEIHRGGMLKSDLNLLGGEVNPARMSKFDRLERESVRADLRRKVRRLLAMYGYPPDLSEDATQLVLKQAKLSTEAAA